MSEQRAGIPVYIEDEKNISALDFFFNVTPVGLAVIDSRGFFTRVNSEFSAGAGLSPTEISGRHYRELVSPLFQAEVDYHLNGMISGKTAACRFRGQFYNRAGETRDIQVDCFSFYYGSTDAVYLLCYCRYCQSFFSEYLPVIHAGFLQWTKANPSPGLLIAGADGNIFYGSRFASDLLGYRDIELAGKYLQDVIGRTQADSLTAKMKIDDFGKYIKTKLRFHHQNNTTFYLPAGIFIDDSDYFRRGRLLVIVFGNTPPRYVCKRRDPSEEDVGALVSEVNKLRESINSYAGIESGLRDGAINPDDYRLTAREKSVLLLFKERKNAKEMAYELGLAEITVRKHMTRLYRKFGVSSREDLLLMLHDRKL